MFSKAGLMLGQSPFGFPDYEEQQTTTKTKTAPAAVSKVGNPTVEAALYLSSQKPSKTEIERHESLLDTDGVKAHSMARRAPSTTTRIKGTADIEVDMLPTEKRPYSGSTDATLSASRNSTIKSELLSSTQGRPYSGATLTNTTLRTSMNDSDESGTLDLGAKSGDENASGHPRTDSTVISDFTIHEIEGHSDVKRILDNKPIITLDEIIDPEAIPENSHIRSPSGHLLSKDEWKAHPTRPRTISERQQAIEEARRRMYAEKTKALLGDQKLGKFDKYEKKPVRPRIASPLPRSRKAQNAEKSKRKSRRFWCCFGTEE